MNSAFATLDWAVFIAYFVVLTVTSVLLSRMKVKSTRDYFVGGNSVPMFAVAVSVLATSQSAATFLGGPEYSYTKDLTFIGFYLSAFVAVWFVAKVLIPRFYAIKAVTVYELLEKRYGTAAKKQAGLMFLIGRLFASGARLYIGALAISMILFLDIEPLHVLVSTTILMLGALAYVYFGGVKSVIFSDIIQAFTYIGAGIAVLVYLFIALDTDMGTIIHTLTEEHKLKTLDWSMSGGFSVWALMGGWLLLNIAAYGLDQDMTQRALSCKNTIEAQRSLMMSIYLTIPVALLFLAIGLLLYLFYHHPEFSGISTEVVQQFDGEKITIFLYYILHEMPEGMRGLVTVGAVAAALSSSNSVLGAMASVAIEDIYKPWKKAKGECDEMHFVRAGRVSVLLFAAALSAMAMLSYYWQQSTELPLLNFALGVMAFAYTGLLGVYAAAIFTKRGNAMSVPLAFISGFATVLLLQPYILGDTVSEIIGWNVGFAWQLFWGTLVSFGVMMSSSKKTL
ncbi:sodium:solute symporter [Sulfurovum sp. zt1-1]|uniref:Sodium:solute symporter n=1 Tax=Sulfurovum zhangzhouensis TaxID=3019067 RepID=A0ABT7QV50_9BACT|nr:sodium:solute symporter [Sulfurovum zhangzhouensis]MDM5270723.1 sodium:solute symporter [Sulfurovum zhangzhouensis]